MYLIDSNIIIYSYLKQFDYLRKIFESNNVFVSEISRVEVLGYHKLTLDESVYFSDVFELLPSILPNRNIFDEAVIIRKAFNLKLGNSLIAATAKEYHLFLYTRNLADFEKVNGLTCINPIP